MKKLLIKVLCGILFLLCIFTGCNGSTSEKTPQKNETSIINSKEESTAKSVNPNEQSLLSAPPIFDPLTSDVFNIKETSNNIKENSGAKESSNAEEKKKKDELKTSTEEKIVAEESEQSNETEESYEIEESYAEEIYSNFSIENEEEDVVEEYIEEDFSYDYEEYVYDSNALYTSEDFQNMGIIDWGGWSWTFYSQQAMPGEDLIIPGRYVDYNGYVCDENDYICLASSSLDKGTVVDTPFGKMGKVYDCGWLSYILDVYVDW